MILNECGVRVNDSLKELKPQGTIDYPCNAYSSFHSCHQEDDIPWHWHEELEIIYIRKGQMEIMVPSKSLTVNEGEMIVINSNVLHYGKSIADTQINSFVFSTSLISGGENYIFYKKYIKPLLSLNKFDFFNIKKEDNQDMIELFLRAFKVTDIEEIGYEFIVRENLSKIVMYLYKELFDNDTSFKNEDNLENKRVKQMLKYIHKNYDGNISLHDIAESANISERECLRCFKKTIQLSPIQYLLKYRIMQGASLLLNDGGKTISQIANLCGFNSASNFSKTFRKLYDLSPKEYRNHSR